MKQFLIVLLVVLALEGVAQKNAATAYFLFDSDYRTYVSKRDDIGYLWGKNQMPKAGYRVGVDYERKLTDRFVLTAGFLFANKGYQSQKDELLYSDQILPKQGFVLPTGDVPYTHFRYRYNYYMFGVPIGVNYYITQGDVKLYTGAGVSFNYLINTRYKVIFYEGARASKVSKRDDDPNAYKKFNIAPYLNIGVEGKLNNNYKYRAFASYSYTVTNVMSDDIVYRIYPYTLGIGAALVKTF